MNDPLDVGEQHERYGHVSCRCDDCGVSWNGDPTCWVCGAKVKTFLPFYVPRTNGNGSNVHRGANHAIS